MKRLINTLKALSDPIRLRIINLLYIQELCVCEIVDALSLPQPTISRHLTILKNVGLVDDKKQGQWVFYNIIVSKDDGNFIKTLIETELQKESIFQKDIEAMQKRLQEERGCINH